MREAERKRRLRTDLVHGFFLCKFSLLPWLPTLAAPKRTLPTQKASFCTHLQLGGALLQLGRLDDSERELTTTYRLAGAQLGGAQLMLGQIYFMEKKYPNALSAFEQYLTDVPQAPNAVEVRGVIGRIRAALSQK
jgi:cytochrome c-type biogenesis protein CcmH/NrfG